MSTTIDSATVTSSIGLDGNSYTTAVSNDELTNEDFITLMLTELSMQDPTDPVDSSSMLDDQLQISNLEANISMTESMEALSTSFAQSALSNSANMIGRIIEDGNTNSSGESSQYKISSVQSEDGTIYLKGYEILGYDDMYYFEPVEDASSIEDGSDETDSLTFTNSDGTSYEFTTSGKSYEELAEEIAAIDGLNADIVETTDSEYQLVVAISDGASSLTQNGVDLNYSTDQSTIYSSELAYISYDDITHIY